MSVCLLAAHPLVLSEFQRLLGDAPFKLDPRRLPPFSASEADVKIPRADVYVIDCEGPRVASESVVAQLVARNPNARIVVVGEDFAEPQAFAFLGLGVKGLLKHADMAQQLNGALQAVAAGGFWVPRLVLSRFVDSLRQRPSFPASTVRATEVSRRERDIIDGLLQNLANKEIANNLNISERTVKFHVSNLLAKFGVRRRADLILLYFQKTQKDTPTSEYVH